MKKFLIAAAAAVVATVSLSTVAEAGWRHRHHGWHGHYHGYWGPRIVIRPVVYDDYCFVKKVRRYDRWGNMYIKRIRICG